MVRASIRQHPMHRIAKFGSASGLLLSSNLNARNIMEGAASFRTKLRGASIRKGAQGSFGQSECAADALVKQTCAVRARSSATAHRVVAEVHASTHAPAGCSAFHSGIICIMKTAAHVATVNVGIYSGIICIMKTAAHVAQWTR